MGLFIKKPLADLMTEANDSGSKSLKRILGPWSLIALGVGVIIGAGLFSITGAVAAGYTGPAITLSFAIAALGCCFAGLCYAEFASMIPVAGSAYTYSYATMGELVAWIIGWDLVLEYCVAATTVSISWSRYLVVFLEGFGVHLPQALTACPWDGGIVNIPAFVIVVLMSILLIRGTEGSSIFNGIIVFLKVSVVLVFVVLGWKYIRMENYTPYIPANTGTLGEFGFSGILRGAAIVFFAFLGFDAVSTAAQETKNPKRNMPIGILMSLVVCTILYMLFAHVMTGVVHYSAFAGQNGIAPVAIAIDHMGQMDASGVIRPDYPWMNRAIVIAILLGYCSVIMVTLLGQSRVFLSMSRDGLLPPLFSHIHEKFRTPARSNFLFMLLVGALAAFVPASVAGEMCSIGTLFAFTLVCAGVLIVRKTMPDAPRSFKTPLVPFVPIAGIITCLVMMLFLPADTWIRLVLWMLIGLDIYVCYGIKHSKLEHMQKHRSGQTTLAIAIDHMGQMDASGVIRPDYPWMNRAIVIAILLGYCSVIMVTLLGQSRVFLSMSRDGLLPPLFSHIHEKFRTPARSNFLFMLLVGALAAFVPASVAGEMCSIGTLFAFTLVCAGVLIVRKTMPDAPRSFKTPLVPFVPIAGIITCLVMMLFLPADTWIRLVLWMLIGLDIYVCYGIKHSKLEHMQKHRSGQTTLDMIGITLSVLCVITGLWHQQTVGWGESKILLIISFVFAFTHLAFYLYRLGKQFTSLTR